MLVGVEENTSVNKHFEFLSWYQIVPGFRVRIIPVLGTIPAIFGQVMASYVVTQLAGLQVETEPVVNLDIDHYRLLHQRLIEHEESLYGTAMQVQVWRLWLILHGLFWSIHCTPFGFVWMMLVSRLIPSWHFMNSASPVLSKPNFDWFYEKVLWLLKIQRKDLNNKSLICLVLHI